MSSINVNDLSALNLTGAELFNDPESFMTELSEESEQVIGGQLQRACPNSCLQPTCVLTRKKCVATRIIVEEVKLSNIAIAL